MDDKLKKAIKTIAYYFTDNLLMLQHDLLKAGTLESMHYHDDLGWIVPVFNQLADEGAKFEIDYLGITIKFKNERTTHVPWYTNKAETYFWACWYRITDSEKLK